MKGTIRIRKKKRRNLLRFLLMIGLAYGVVACQPGSPTLVPAIPPITTPNATPPSALLTQVEQSVLPSAFPNLAGTQPLPGFTPLATDAALPKTISTPTWPVIFPPRSTFQPFTTPTPGAAITRAPMFAALNNVQSLVSALPPAKDFAPLGKNQLPVKEVQIEPKQVVQADVNNDGSLETLLVSLIHPTYGDPAWDNYPNGRISLALFSAEGSLIWSTASTLPQYVAKLSVDAQPVDLSPQETGILFRQSVTMQDSGDNRNGQATLYRWNGNSLASVWQWETQAEGQGGAGISQGFQDTIQLEDINHDGIQEILVQRSLFSLDLSQPSDAVNARVDLPGALVFQWKGQTYVPAYYQNGDLLTPIRPWPLIGFAAHVTKPIQVDGDPTDWQQLEYFRGPPLAISSAQPPMSLGARVAWDDQKMYITGQAAPGQVVTVGLDTGLAIDFTDTTINKDNIVLQVFIPGDASCSGTTSISISSSTRDTSGFAAAAQLSNSPGNCNYELSIPLQAIDLNPAALVSSPGWMQGSPSPTQARLYHPNAGQAIGFAIAVDGHGSTPTFQVDDPTTWATLIFIADR